MAATFYHLLLLIHITCFAIWMGAIVASLLLVRTLQPRLTAPNSTANAEQDAALLQSYIRREIKLVDVVFLGVLLSGVVLAQGYTGWTAWVLVKVGLFITQVAATMGYVFWRVRPLTYPCSPHDYRRWYELIALSLSFFALTLLVVYFGR